MANKHHDQMGAGFNGGKRWSPPKRTFGTPGMNMKTPDFPGLPGKESNIDWGDRNPKEKANYPQKKGL